MSSLSEAVICQGVPLISIVHNIFSPENVKESDPIDIYLRPIFIFGEGKKLQKFTSVNIIANCSGKITARIIFTCKKFCKTLSSLSNDNTMQRCWTGEHKNTRKSLNSNSKLCHNLMEGICLLYGKIN